MKVQPYWKFVIALSAALAVLATAGADGTIDVNDGIQVMLAFAGALGVYVKSNDPVEG